MHDTTAAEQRALRARRLTLLGACLTFAALAAAPAGDAPLAASRPLDEPTLVAHTAGVAVDVATPASLDDLRADIAAVLEREGVAGVGLALVDRDGVVWSGGVGLADRASGRPVDADTQFRVGSITKSVVALGVARLAEQGRLDLERPLSETMPEIEMANPWAASSPITLAHVLEHTAGFDDMRFNEYYAAEGTSPRDALALNPRSRVARWRPGTRMSYANPGYTVAGHAIELATGEAWDAWLEREVLTPLGMPTARFRRTPELADRLATGYLDRERVAPFHPIAHAPAGSLLASPRELAALVHFWLVRGEGTDLVDRATLARIERPGSLDHRGPDTAYGLGNYGDVLHPARSRGHDGGIHGFLSCYRYFPELGLGYVMLLNATHSPRAYAEIRGLLFAHLARGRELPPPPTARPDPDALAAAAGFYHFDNPRMQLLGFIQRATEGISLRADPHGLGLTRLAGGAATLVPTGADGYRLPHQSGASVRLTADREGRRIVDAGMVYFSAGSHTFAWLRLRALQAALLLIQLTPLWTLGWALRAGLRRFNGRALAPGELALHLWTAAAAVLFAVLPSLLLLVFELERFATANPWSIGLCLCTLAFAAASAGALAEAIRAAVAGKQPLLRRLFPSAAAVACFGMTLYLIAHGIIGLRTWAW